MHGIYGKLFAFIIVGIDRRNETRARKEADQAASREVDRLACRSGSPSANSFWMSRSTPNHTFT
jgi:hypothetical protein